jgi:hypothetical protein
MNATVRPYATSEVYSFPSQPKLVPTLFLLTVNSDAASPANFLEAYISTGGPATLNEASVPAGDRALNAGEHSTSAAAATADYVEASRAYAESGYFIAIADLKAVLYARKTVGVLTWTGGNPFGPIYATTGAAGES